MKVHRHEWGRLRQIAEVMARHGLVMALDGIGLSSYLSLGRRLRADRLPQMDAEWPDRVRLVLADLGPTYVKLGQLASVRPDVLPEPLVQALQRLQDDVPAIPYSEIAEILQQAWGAPLTDMVAFFREEPLAAASIGQVHEAQLEDGRRVVIKVRRPGIREQAQADFHILRSLAEMAEKRTQWAKQYAVSDLVDEILTTMQDELDFTIEAQNTDRARQNAKGNSAVKIPEVIWSLTRPDVLVLESVPGMKVNDGEGIQQAGLSSSQVAETFVRALYQQIFVHGFFHADPHPGNIHVDGLGNVIFLDWGLVGMLSREMKQRSVALVLGLVDGNSEAVADALLEIAGSRHQVDRRGLLRDVERLRRRYYETRLQDFQLGKAMSDLFQMAQRHQLRIPAEYMLLAKTAVTADGVVRAIAPEFSLLAMGKPLAGELLWNKVNPENWVPGVIRDVTRASQAIASIPEEIELALRTLSRGEIRIVLEQKNIERILAHWETLINRVAFAFLLGAIVLGAALVVHRDHLDELAGIPVGEYAFFLALALVVWAIVSALRRGKQSS